VPNIRMKPYRHASSFRRIAAVAWDPPRDPTIYGTTQVPAAALLEWIAAKRAAGTRVTVTHAVTRALAVALAEHPDLNGFVRWGRLYLREDINIFLQVAIEREGESIGKTDLSGVLIRGADGKDVATIADELQQGARRVRSGEDADFQRTKSQAEAIPGLVYRVLIRLIEFLQYGLNMDTTFLGAPGDPFGSAMVTSLGMRGVNIAYAPFFPLARAPILLLVGAVQEVPAAVDGELVIRPELTLNGTFDHRIIDGAHAAILSARVRELLMDPALLD